MEAMRRDEDPEFSHSDREEDGECSTDDETIASERDVVEERVGPESDASAEDRGPDAIAQGSNLDRGSGEETAIMRPSSTDEPLEESPRSSTGSGVPLVARSVSVETGLRNRKVSEGGVPRKGERTLVVSLVKARVVYVCSDAVTPYSLPFGFSTTGDDLDRGGKVEATDLESDQGLDDDGTDDEEGDERQVMSSRIKERVATEITRDKNRQRKYHAKKSAQRSKGGRIKGSKAKNSAKQQVAGAEWL